MNISSVNLVALAPTDTPAPAQTAEQASKRAILVQAVKVVNDSNTLGENQELTFVVDRTTHQTLTRIIDRQTQEVLMQIPPEYVVRLAQQLKERSSADDR